MFVCTFCGHTAKTKKKRKKKKNTHRPIYRVAAQLKSSISQEFCFSIDNSKPIQGNSLLFEREGELVKIRKQCFSRERGLEK